MIAVLQSQPSPMTKKNTPVGMLFELQRETIEQTGELLEQVVELSADVSDGDAVSRQRDIADETVELGRESIHRSLDTVALFAGDREEFDEVREAIDTTFDTVRDQQGEAFDRFETQTEEFESELLARIEDQVELLIELSEELEQQLTEVAAEFVTQAEEGGLTEGFEQQFDQLAERFGEQAERFSNLEEQFERIEIESPDEQ